MPTFVQRSFSGGEISPALWARADVVKYQTGLKTCRNFLVQRHGGVANRPGTQYVATAKSNDVRTRLIPWVFNAAQTYVLEFGDQYIRFYRDGGQIVVSSVTAWNSGTSYVAGDLASRLGVNYYCKTAHTNQTPPNTTYWYPLTGDIFEIPTPYAIADVGELQFVQSGDVMTIAHKNYAPRDLSRTGHTAWTLTTITFAPSISKPTGISASAGSSGSKTYYYTVTAVKDGNYEESEPGTAYTLSSAAAPTTSNPHTVTWTAVSGAREYNVYRQYNGVYGFIGTAYGAYAGGTPTFEDTGYVPDTSIQPPLVSNPFSGAGYYPGSVSYYQQRQVFASSTNYPERVWMSQTGNFDNLSNHSPIQDDDAITFDVVGRHVNEVKHLIEVGKLLVLTSGAEWSLDGSSGGGVTPTEINLRAQSYYGASSVPPIVSGSTLLYVQARGGIIRDLRYQLETDGYSGDDLTIFANHMFDGKQVTSWAYQQIPHSIVWVVMDDNTLLGLTYVREQQVWGWHRHDTDGTWLCVCTVPGETEDEVWFIVQREIDGAVVNYVEKFAPRGTHVDTMIYADSTLSYQADWNVNEGEAFSFIEVGGGGYDAGSTIGIVCDTAPGPFVSGDAGKIFKFKMADGTVYTFEITQYLSANSIRGTCTTDIATKHQDQAESTYLWARSASSISGLDHLEGKTVSVLADGNTMTKTVSGGAITLSTSGAGFCIVHVGLPVTSEILTLDIDIPQGTIAERQKLITEVTMSVESAGSIFVGPDEDNLIEYQQRTTEPLGTPVNLLTGSMKVKTLSTWETNGRVMVKHESPLPITVLSIMPSGMMGD